MIRVNMTNYIKRDALWVPENNEAGVAYAFFDSSASKKQIEELAWNEGQRLAERGDIGKLEVALAEVKDIKESTNPELYDFVKNNEIYATYSSACKDQMKNAKPIQMKDLKYILQTVRHEKTDQDAANFLGNVMNDVYRKYESTTPFKDAKPFNVAIVYRNPQDGYLDFKRD